jgi:ABC-2 type transport system permease protein
MSSPERFADLSSQPLQRIGAEQHLLRGTVTSVVDIFRQRELLGLLVRRDLKSRYKNSALGFVWTLVRPLTQLLIYYFVVGQVLGAASGIPDFAVYVFSGLTVYTLFSEILAGSTTSIVGNSGLIKKVYLPREIFPLATVGSSLFNFGIQGSILLLATIVLGVPPQFPQFLYLIPALLIVVIYGFAFGLLLSALNVYLRDVQYLIEVGLMVLLWGSPIVYGWDMVKGKLGEGLLMNLYTDNPVTLAVLGFHKAFWSSGGPEAYPADMRLRMGIAIVVGIVLLWVFQRIFARLQGNFAQEL